MDVATRIATMESISPETLDHVEEVLSQIKSPSVRCIRDRWCQGGAEVLNNVGQGAEKNILGNLREKT